MLYHRRCYSVARLDDTPKLCRRREHQDKRKRRSLESEDALDMIALRQHVFTSKRNFLSGCVCEKCKEAIRYCVLFVKCNACKLSYHETCSRKLKMPCLPRLITPKRNDLIHLKALRLADFCPDTSPMIPHLIIHCIMHLEKSVCSSVLYTAFGDDAKAAKLLVDFKSQRNVPDLIEYDTTVIAGCVMMFLMQIRDPLILLSSHQEFFKASNEDELLESINALPTTHRDTLVYLVNHWKRISEENSNGNFMVEKLCNSLGPIVFGTSRQAISMEKNEQARAALLRIFQLPFDSLKRLLNPDDSSFKGALTRNDSDSRKNKPLMTIKIN